MLFQFDTWFCVGMGYLLIVGCDSEDIHSLAVFLKNKNRSVRLAHNTQQVAELTDQWGEPCLVIIDMAISVERIAHFIERLMALKAFASKRTPIVVTSVVDVRPENLEGSIIGIIKKTLNYSKLESLIETYCEASQSLTS